VQRSEEREEALATALPLDATALPGEQSGGGREEGTFGRVRSPVGCLEVVRPI